MNKIYDLEIKKDPSEKTYGFYVYKKSETNRDRWDAEYTGDGFETEADVKAELNYFKDMLNDLDI